MPPIALSRTPFSARNHQPLRLALLSVLPELPGCGRSARQARDHRFLRNYPTMVSEVQSGVRTKTETTGQGRLGNMWFLDEAFVTINGQRQYLWRAVDQYGEVVDILVQSRRNRRAAERFFRKLLKDQGRVPFRLVTDKSKSYGAALRTIMPSVNHDTGQYANNSVEVSHQSTRQRERQMRRFKSVRQAQIFLSVHGVVLNLFRLGRHRLKSVHYRMLRTRSFSTWEAITAA